jgi:hypothetical protein
MRRESKSHNPLLLTSASRNSLHFASRPRSSEVQWNNHKKVEAEMTQKALLTAI